MVQTFRHVLYRLYDQLYMCIINWGKQCFPRQIEVEWTFCPVKEYKLLNPASSLQDIQILHRGGTQIPTGCLVQ